jgi:hypothetical protein
MPPAFGSQNFTFSVEAISDESPEYCSFFCGKLALGARRHQRTVATVIGSGDTKSQKEHQNSLIFGKAPESFGESINLT